MKKQLRTAFESEKGRVQKDLERRKEVMETVLFTNMQAFVDLPTDRRALNGDLCRVVCIVNTSVDGATREAFRTLKQYAPSRLSPEIGQL